MTRLTKWIGAIGALALTALVVPGAASGSAEPEVLEPTSPIVADVTTGGGASFMRLVVTRHGNLLFESPKGWTLSNFDEGYALCEGSDEAVVYDLPVDEVLWNVDPDGEAGLGPATVTQPEPGAFPVTIVRRTLDGRLRLTQVWAAPDAAEKDVTVTMTVRNVGTTPVGDLSLMRSAESHASDVGGFFQIATTQDSVVQWWAESTESEAHGLVMTARTVGKPHIAGVATDIDIPLVCGADPGVVPGDLIGGGYPQITYEIGTLAPRAEATVAFVYRRL